MNRNCKCGGILHPWSDNPVYFIFKCNRCGGKIKQRKRQPAVKSKELLVVKLYGSNGEVLIDESFHVTDIEEVMAAMEAIDCKVSELDEGKLPR